MTCPDCGASVDGDHLFCASCGSPVRPVLEPGDEPTTVVVAAPATEVVAADPAQEQDGPPEATSDAAPAMVQPLAPCPRCGAQNSSRRQQCARCGTPLLGDGEQPDGPGTAGDLGDGLVEAETEPARRSSRGLAIGAALLGLAGFAVGGTALAGSGVLGEGDGAAGDAGYEPSRYPAELTALEMPRIVADTEHEPIGDNRYDISLVDDGDPATAWNSDGDLTPDGIGERIRIELAQPAWLMEVQLVNGYQKSRKSFTDNARPTLLRMTLDGATYELELLDQEGRQSIELDEPRLTTHVQLEVLQAEPGTTYEDLAISELDLLGKVAVGEDVERAQLQRDGSVPSVTPEVGDEAAG